MARDYGYKGAPRRRSSGPNQLLLVVCAFAGGYLAANFFDSKQLSHWLSTQVVSEKVAPAAAPKHQEHAAQVPPKPKFEFYTLLANEKVPSQTNSATKTASTSTSTSTGAAAPAPAPAKPKITVAAKSEPAAAARVAAVKVVEARPVTVARNTGRGSFTVQVAAFKARGDAEHIKGLLTLKGYDVQVVSVSQTNGNWYRVLVGPYQNRVQAQQAQVSLARNEHLRGMIR